MNVTMEADLTKVHNQNDATGFIRLFGVECWMLVVVCFRHLISYAC